VTTRDSNRFLRGWSDEEPRCELTGELSWEWQ
jgi:hypothetical protein